MTEDGPRSPAGTRPGCGYRQPGLADGQGSLNPGSRQPMGKKYRLTSLSSMTAPGSHRQENKTTEKGLKVLFFMAWFCRLRRRDGEVFPGPGAHTKRG